MHPSPSGGSAPVAAAEALDRRILLDYAETQRRIWPAGDAAAFENTAGLAVFDGAARDSRLACVGAAGGLAAVDGLIEWHAAARSAARFDPPRHARCRLVLAPGASAGLLGALGDRGFTYRSHAPVMWRRLDDLPALDGMSITDAGPALRTRAVETIAHGYCDGAAPDALALKAGETWFDLPGATHALAMLDGEIAGGGAVVVHGAHALLGQMSVLPSHRRRGVQRALLAHRLHHARARGVALAFATCAPGGPSLRNLRRAGFAISHVRISLTG